MYLYAIKVKGGMKYPPLLLISVINFSYSFNLAFSIDIIKIIT